MIASEIKEAIEIAAEIYESLDGDQGDRIVDSIAGFSWKLHEALVKKGFSRSESILILTSVLQRKN